MGHGSQGEVLTLSSNRHFLICLDAPGDKYMYLVQLVCHWYGLCLSSSCCLLLFVLDDLFLDTASCSSSSISSEYGNLFISSKTTLTLTALELCHHHALTIETRASWLLRRPGGRLDDIIIVSRLLSSSSCFSFKPDQSVT